MARGRDRLYIVSIKITDDMRPVIPFQPFIFSSKKAALDALEASRANLTCIYSDRLREAIDDYKNKRGSIDIYIDKHLFFFESRLMDSPTNHNYFYISISISVFERKIGTSEYTPTYCEMPPFTDSDKSIYLNRALRFYKDDDTEAKENISKLIRDILWYRNID